MRLTINLNAETNELLEELVAEGGTSKSQVVRNALSHYYSVHQEWSHVTEEQLLWYVRLLSSKEHRILDVDHIDTLLSSIETSEELMEKWRHIGRKHGIEWRQQFDSLEKKLRVLEYCNWFTITTVDDDQYALTFQDEKEADLMGAFIEAECEELDLDVEMRYIGRKVVITDQTGR
jgi:metal-responsive CopG/Arc/MetJ family transcriptional regulator